MAVALGADVVMHLLGDVAGHFAGLEKLHGQIGGVQADLQEAADVVRAMPQHHGPADAGAVAFDFGANTEMDDLAGADAAQGRPTDCLGGIGAGATPDWVSGGLGAIGQHGGGGNAA